MMSPPRRPSDRGDGRYHDVASQRDRCPAGLMGDTRRWGCNVLPG
jgi:hypothetical protein